MGSNTKQKVKTININDLLEDKLKEELQNGAAFQFIVNLQPSVNKILLIYALPPDIE